MMLIKTVLFLLLITLSNISYGTKYPNLYLAVSMRVMDWEAKEPVRGVNAIVFLNDSKSADNNGWAPEVQIAKSNKTGFLTSRAILYRGITIPKKVKVEIVLFADGYRTEKFILYDVPLELFDSRKKYNGKVNIGDVKIFKLKKTAN
ncbi:MAG: hypothetical protein R3B45_09570 [Bdellovibrionota bacterium]